MKTFNDLKIGDRIYWIGETKCCYGIFEIKSIDINSIITIFIPDNVIGDINEVAIIPSDYYCESCEGLCYDSNKLFVTIYANEDDFLKQLEILGEI